jgi:Fe-S cluster assembly protein SufD
MTAVAEQIGARATEAWLAEFTAQAKTEPWVQALRAAAFERFAELGFPTTRDEEWRFTNVAPIARAPWKNAPASGGGIVEAAKQHLGKHAPETAFTALNTAFLDRLHFYEVPRGTVREEPIEITYDAQADTAHHPRALIVVGPHAHCTIVETYRGTGKYFTNAVTEIVAGEGAVIDHYKIQLESPEAFHVATLQATLGRSANFSSHSISFGALLARNDAGAALSEGTEATLNGLYIVTGSQHIDNHTVLDHAKPNGASHEVYKGILDGRAGAVFNGRIIVRKDAQKTDSKQTNKNLVLSDDAVINTKPELQIHADDVRCTHGATIGQLDAESLFYLRSRGIPKREARSLLIYAFAQDIVGRIKIAPLRESLERMLFEKFHEHGA